MRQKSTPRKNLSCVLLCSHPLGILAYLNPIAGAKNFSQLVIEGASLEDYYSHVLEEGFIIDDRILNPERRISASYSAPIVDQRLKNFTDKVNANSIVSVASFAEYYHNVGAKVGQKIDGKITWNYNIIKKHRNKSKEFQVAESR